jgi:tRNA-dihydrouridine synthase
VLQLGGSDPGKLAAAAHIAARYGYDEMNLNCGCPSDRVAGAGCFGAALMLRPEVVAEGCAAMRAALGDTPVTVKCRLGADDVDSYEALCNFVGVVSAAGGVRHFIIHARKCLLKGLSPHQNRTVPPLRCAPGASAHQRAPHVAATVTAARLCSTCLTCCRKTHCRAGKVWRGCCGRGTRPACGGRCPTRTVAGAVASLQEPVRRPARRAAGPPACAPALRAPRAPRAGASGCGRSSATSRTWPSA